MSIAGSANRTLPFEQISIARLPERWQRIAADMPDGVLSTMAEVGLSSVVHGLGGHQNTPSLHSGSSPLLRETQHYSSPNTFLPGHPSDPESAQAAWFGRRHWLIDSASGCCCHARAPKCVLSNSGKTIF